MGAFKFKCKKVMVKQKFSFLFHQYLFYTVSRCNTRGESQEFIACRWQSTQARDPPWLWNLGEMLPEVQNRGISGPTKRTYVLQQFYWKKEFVPFFCSTMTFLHLRFPHHFLFHFSVHLIYPNNGSRVSFKRQKAIYSLNEAWFEEWRMKKLTMKTPHQQQCRQN